METRPEVKGYSQVLEHDPSQYKKSELVLQFEVQRFLVFKVNCVRGESQAIAQFPFQ